MFVAYPGSVVTLDVENPSENPSRQLVYRFGEFSTSFCMLKQEGNTCRQLRSHNLNSAIVLIFVDYTLLLLQVIWLWINTYRYIFSGVNIHLPAILMFTRGIGF